MEKPKVVMTLGLGDEQQAFVRALLAGRAEVAFLADEERERRMGLLREADVLVGFHPTRDLEPEELGALGHVRLFQLLSAGWDHVPFDRLPETMTIASNAGAYAEPMAEHVLAMALALAKRLREGHESLARGEFAQLTMTRSLRHIDVAILGFGGIGKATARLLEPFDVRIHAINTSGRTELPVAFCGTIADLETVLRLADLVVVSLPLTRDTAGLLGERELSWLKSECILVNVARGEIIDQGALYRHLKANPGLLAGIDAWWVEPMRHGRFEVEHPFFELPNFLGSPHNSAMVPGFDREAMRRALENVVRLAEGRPLTGVIDRARA